jgi:hypothetical protein
MQHFELQMNDHDYQFLEELRIRSGAKSLTEMIRNALNTYHWLTSKVEEGYTIVAESPTDHQKEAPILPIRPLVRGAPSERRARGEVTA